MKLPASPDADSLITPAPRIGVLALQGDFAEHIHAIERSGGRGEQVRYSSRLSELDGLIIPGGESTTISKLLQRNRFEQPIREAAAMGFPIWGTCAGLIMIAKHLTDPYPVPLGLMDVTVSRNWFGRQKESFEMDLPVKGMTGKPFRCVFIRAPLVLETGEEWRLWHPFQTDTQWRSAKAI